MKIAIVGVGALGSHTVLLVRNLKASVSVVDFDKVERKNVASQFHAQNAVGKSKAQALQQAMQFLFAMKIAPIPHKLTSQNDDQILSGYDLIVDCLDNGEARRLVQSFARKTKTPCVHGALAADGEFGRIVWDEDFRIDDESGIGAPTCEGGDFLPFIAIVSAYLAQAVQHFAKTGAKIGYQVTPAGTIRI